MEKLFALYIEINVTITHGSFGDACGLTLCSPYSKWKTAEHDRIVPILLRTYDVRLSFIFSHRYLCYISPLRREVLSSYLQKFNFYLAGGTARREYLFNDVLSCQSYVASETDEQNEILKHFPIVTLTTTNPIWTGRNTLHSHCKEVLGKLSSDCCESDAKHINTLCEEIILRKLRSAAFSFAILVRLHGSTTFPLDGFSSNFMLRGVTKI